MQNSQTNITIPKGDNNKITFLPSEKIVSENSISDIKTIIKMLQEEDIKYYHNAMPFLDNLDYIGEIILFCINRVANKVKKTEKKWLKKKRLKKN